MIEGFEPVVVDTLGGLCTLVERSDLPLGLSPLAQNVQFFPGGVRTRDGFKAYLQDAGTPTDGFRAAYDHVDGRGTRHHLIYQGGTGKLGSRTTGTTISSVIAKLGAPSTFSTMKAASQYGRVFVCISDGRRGLVPPFQYDGVLTASAVGATGAHEAYPAYDAFGGSMVAGLYYVAVSFETATGYITGPTKLATVTLSGTGQIDITSIPLGPPGTVKRRLFISLVDTFELYNPPGLILNDNTTTVLNNVNLTQAEIAAGLPFSEYINLQPPTAHLGVVAYSNRLVYWGGDGKINSFFGPTTTGINPTYSSVGLLNLDFSAEIASAYTWGTPGVYAEWYGTSAAAAVTAGSVAQGEVLNYLSLTSAGGATDALVEQGWGSGDYRINRDELGMYYLQPGRRYGIRARVRNAGSAAAGNLKIVLYQANSVGPSRTAVATLTVPMSTTGANWAIYESDGTTDVTVSPNVAMDVYLNSVTSGKTVDVSRIEVYDVESKRGFSTLDISRVDDPESFDVVLGRVTVSPNDGQEVRNAFPLRGNLYIAKERSIYVTQDNGQEPAFWNNEIVSSTVGTPSVHGVGMGDGWVVIASRDGLYYFDGGAPQKVSQEIQPTWDLFDWTKGERLYCDVNTLTQTVVIGGPTAAGWQQLRLNYVDGWGNPLADGNGRKWSTDVRYSGSTDTGAFTHATSLILDSGARVTAYCVSDDSARLVHDDAATRSDYSGRIASYYETAPIGTDMARSLFGQLTHKIRGSGTLLSWLVRPDGSTTALPSKTLSASPIHDVEIRVHQSDTQLGLRVGVAATDHYFIAKRLSAWRKPAPFSRIRGY